MTIDAELFLALLGQAHLKTAEYLRENSEIARKYGDARDAQAYQDLSLSHKIMANSCVEVIDERIKERSAAELKIGDIVEIRVMTMDGVKWFRGEVRQFTADMALLIDAQTGEGTWFPNELGNWRRVT